MQLSATVPQTRAMRFAVLGPLAVEVDGRPLPLGPVKQRLVLAVLLLHANTPVSVDLLTEAIWQDEPPRSARKNVQQHVCAVRRMFSEAGERDRLVNDSGGYLLRVAEPELDSLRLRALTRAGRQARYGGDPVRAARLFREALELWRGAPLADLCGSDPVRAAADRLAERCVGLQEDWAEAELALGNAQEVADAAEDLADRYPLRERLRAAQMTALHRTGRQTEALAVYDGLRQLLAREVGLDPSPALKRLYRSILAHGVGRAFAHEPSRTLLPPDDLDFTGRRQQVGELLDAVRPGGGLTVVAVGPAGIGKTSLVVHVAHRLHEEFPDSRVLVSLRDEHRAPRPTAAVLAELARLTGLPGPLPEDPAHATAHWRAWLADRRVLLVLDDVPDEAAVRPLLPGGGGSAALVTSRSSLSGLASARHVSVPLFSPAEAVELLGRIIGRPRLRGDRAAAERIVGAAGLLPLAVRASGRRLAVLRHLPLSEYADRLAQPRAALDEPAAGDLSVRDRLADGWRDLPESVRTTVRRLGRLPVSQPFTVNDAATTLGCSPGSALRQLEALIDTGVVLSPDGEVSAHAVLYRLPRLAHLFATEVGEPV